MSIQDYQNRWGEQLFAPPTVPQCGWLSPEGWFAPCIPWEHAEVAGDICRVLEIDLSAYDWEPHAALWALGWVKIERKSKADHSQFGGRFCWTTHGASKSLTEPQKVLEQFWMEHDALYLG